MLAAMLLGVPGLVFSMGVVTHGMVAPPIPSIRAPRAFLALGAKMTRDHKNFDLAHTLPSGGPVSWESPAGYESAPIVDGDEHHAPTFGQRALGLDFVMLSVM